jgi:hypothetical protein
MEENSVIAKNLLEGKTCQNCKYRDRTFCIQTVGDKVIANPLPDDNTCSKWELKKLPKKLNVRWTKEMEVDLAKYHGLSAEEEITKTVSETMRKEIDDEITMKIKDIKFGK